MVSEDVIEFSPERVELREELRELSGREDLAAQDLDAHLADLEQRHGESVYAAWIELLSNLRFRPSEARRHWSGISSHRRAIQERLGSGVDPRVALVDYFTGVEPRLQNPKVIEMSQFEQTRDLAYRDELTGLHNYRGLDEHLKREVSRTRRSGSPLSVLMIDVDDFKVYNDHYGHDAGNLALSTVARLLSETLRQEDLAARFGGEEFCIVLSGTPKSGANVVAERIRQKVERHLFPRGVRDRNSKLTVSIGIATFPADATGADDLIGGADRALYAAKASGKNRVHLFGGSTRSDRRMNVVVPGRYRTLVQESHPISTVKISTGGMLLVSDQELPLGSLVEIELLLPENDSRVRVPGRVVSVNQAEDGTFEAAVRTRDISTDQGILIRELLN